MFGTTNMLILKVTRDCNLRCSYCYVKNKDNYKGEMMTFDTFKTIIDRVVSDRHKNEENGTFTLIFHGGEPLLMGAAIFGKFLSYASRTFKRNGVDYQFGIQTNLTLLNEELLILLHDYKVSIGVSFDGIKESNSERTDINTDNFEKQFKMLEEFNEEYGFLIVASQTNINSIPESLDYVFDKFDIQGIKVNYAEDINNLGNSEVGGKEFAEKAWISIVESYIDGKYNTMPEGNMKEIIRKHFAKQFTGVNVSDETKSNCGLKICGGGMHIIEINPDGSVFYCGRYSEDYDEVFIQNVHDDEFLELTQIRRYMDTVGIQHKLITDLNCDLCPADNICDHGCMAFHFSKFGEFGIRDDLVCNIFKTLHTYLIKNELRIFMRMFETGKNQDNIWYYNTGVNMIGFQTNGIINRLARLGYNVQLDNNFKGSDNYNPQLKVTKA